MRTLGALTAAALLGAGCSCDPLAQNGTAVRVRVDIAPDVTVNQLRFALTHDGGALFTPVVRPETEGARLESGGSLLVLVEDALDGQSVDCEVAGLVAGQTVTQGQSSAAVVKGREVPCAVSLLAPTGCGPSTCSGCCAAGACVAGTANTACGSSGSSCFGCGSGQHCVAGGCTCDVTSCGGCCSGDVCLDGGSPLACGKGGLQCAACPSSQSCDDGACGCDGGACGTGCSQTTCANGCCSGGECLGSGAASCGIDAALCVDCRTDLTDTCSASGACSCGTVGPCAPMQHCVGGHCICDSSACPNGCCSNGACLMPAPEACGTGGNACSDCRALLTDSCRANGTCGCGTGAPCSTGQHCVAGHCDCDAQGCPSGCCQSTACYTVQTKQHCGNDGGMCKGCGGSMQCVAGACQ